MTYISCFSDFAFYFYYYFMENCHTWIIISKWQNDLHTNTSRSVWPILYGLMIKMLQYKMYPAGELAVLRQLLFITGFLLQYLGNWYRTNGPLVNFTIFNTSNKNKAGDINSPWNLLVYYNLFFRENKSWQISCKSSAWLMIHMKFQDYSLKK